jgi:hypothetical protein
MAEHTYEQLRDMTVVQLREVAQGLGKDAPEGYSARHKEQLLPALAKALGLHAHHAAAGTEKTLLKGRLHKLKAQRDAARAAGKNDDVTAANAQIRHLRHRLRRMIARSA